MQSMTFMKIRNHSISKMKSNPKFLISEYQMSKISNIKIQHKINLINSSLGMLKKGMILTVRKLFKSRTLNQHKIIGFNKFKEWKDRG